MKLVLTILFIFLPALLTRCTETNILQPITESPQIEIMVWVHKIPMPEWERTDGLEWRKAWIGGDVFNREYYNIDGLVSAKDFLDYVFWRADTGGRGPIYGNFGLIGSVEPDGLRLVRIDNFIPARDWLQFLIEIPPYLVNPKAEYWNYRLKFELKRK